MTSWNRVQSTSIANGDTCNATVQQCKQKLLAMSIGAQTSAITILLLFSISYALPAVADDKETEDALIELETVVVKAASVAKSLPDPPGMRSIIKAETIERRLMRNIKDLVRYEPGIDVVNDPQRFGLGAFTIRGIGGNRVQMLVDGIRMPEAFAIGTFQSAGRNMVDIDALKAVDIVRGANSAINGSDGIAGTVNFVTKDPQDYLKLFGKDHYESLKLLYGSSNDNFSQTLTFAAALNKWESMMLFTHAAGQETDNMGKNTTQSSARTAPNPQDMQIFNGLTKLLYHVNADNTLRLTAEALQNDVETQVYHLYGLQFTGRNTTRFLTDDAQSRRRLSLDQMLEHIGWRWLDSAKWRLYGQVSDTRQRVDENRSTPLKVNEHLKREFTYEQAMLGGDFQGLAEFKQNAFKQRLSYGVELLSTDIEALRDGSLANLNTGQVTHQVIPDNFPVRDFPLTTTIRGGLFLQDNLTLWKGRLELMPALRLDYFGIRPKVDAIFAKDNPDNVPGTLDFFEPSPKFGVLWHFDETFTVHGQYAEGFRAPNFSESNLGFVNYTFGYASVPNQNLKPETSWGGEWGIRAKGAAGSFDATFFHTVYQGFIQSVIACDPVNNSACRNGLLTYQTQNTPDEVRIRGVEFKSEWQLQHLNPRMEGFQVLGSFAYTEGQNLGNDKPISSVSPMNGVLGLRFDAPNGAWGTEAIIALAAAKKADEIDFEVSGDVFPVGGYALVDLNGYYRFGEHVTLTAGVFNLLDKKYIQWQDVRSRGSDPHAALGMAADIRDRYTRAGRNAGISLRMEF